MPLITGSALADMKAGHRFTAPGDDLERLLYGFSLLIYLPDSVPVPVVVYNLPLAAGVNLTPEDIAGMAEQ